MVPVPVVLEEENVKTLESAIFAHVDKLAAPRLVEYWEQDPCRVIPPPMPMAMAMAVEEDSESAVSDSSLGVQIEAQFSVGEYDIVVLSASIQATRSLAPAKRL